MTEVEWLECSDPWPMLQFLRAEKGEQNKQARRKVRLFACACCRAFLPHLHQRYREAVEASEHYADGAVSYRELRRAWETSLGIDRERSQPDKMWAHLTTMAANPQIWSSARLMTRMLAATGEWSTPGYQAVLSYKEQATLFRDIFGNPFRPVKIKHSWLSWNENIIPKLAQSIYDERAFNHLPILADALEEAGCTNADILNHCRLPGEHVRGCWVIDLILGKK